MRPEPEAGGVQVRAVIPPEMFRHRIGVAEIMRKEARAHPCALRTGEQRASQALPLH